MYVIDNLSYNPMDGVFTWKDTGEPAGHKISAGYILISFNRHDKVYAHRLAYYFMGEECPDLVDHINGVKWDNRWVNLRNADKCHNACNSKVRVDNKWGVKGLSWDRKRQRWRASITFRGKTTTKRFKLKEDAENFLQEKRKELHSDFARFI